MRLAWTAWHGEHWAPAVLPGAISTTSGGSSIAARDHANDAGSEAGAGDGAPPHATSATAEREREREGDGRAAGHRPKGIGDARGG